MKVKDVGINAVEWTAAGTTIEIGFAQSESDGREDDWTLTETRLSLSNDEIKPHLVQIIARFRKRIGWAVELAAGLPISPEAEYQNIAST